MTKFQYLERVADWVKTSQLESEGCLPLGTQLGIYNCCLAVQQPTLGHSERDSNSIFFKVFSTILTRNSPGAL